MRGSYHPWQSRNVSHFQTEALPGARFTDPLPAANAHSTRFPRSAGTIVAAVSAPRSKAFRPSPASPALRLLAAFVAVFAAALVAAAGARAEIVTSRDNEGRPITFDVLADGVDVEWYAAILRGAVHGDEISRVTIRIVPPSAIRTHCGPGAVACYGARGRVGLMHVPAGRSAGVAQTFLHEYGHHVDHAWPGLVGTEPNGTSAWWTARGMQSLYDRGLVAFDYSLGWNRSVGEIFAEDYAYIHMPGGYSISWLAPPDEALKTVLVTELTGGTVTPTPPAAPQVRPLVIDRRGTLRAGTRQVVPFGLLGPGRRITFTSTVGRKHLAGTRARIEIVCNGRSIGSAGFVRGRASRTLDLRRRGPGRCQARLVSTSRAALAYTLRLRVSIEGARAPA